jgi:hypothetical protein
MNSPVRCAIYTRKSTEEGLDQDFNSLDAQREAAEAFIASQRHEGWVAVEGRYDDGGFTGANMERPALARLLADIEAGRVDTVIVYKVDRLSRSLMDFSRIIGLFDQHGVAFVSVTLVRNKHGALLKGLLRCKACGAAMAHSFTRRGDRMYRYYVCGSAQRSGYASCATRGVSAAEIERFVVERIRALRASGELRVPSSEFMKCAVTVHTSGAASPSCSLPTCGLQPDSDERDLRDALAAFDPVWEHLAPAEQARAMRLLVEQVAYDGAAGTVAITFRAPAPKAERQALEAHETAKAGAAR